jgi:hypothetical protein
MEVPGMELKYVENDGVISLVINRKKKYNERLIREKDFDKLVLTEKIINLVKGKIPENDFINLINNCFNKYKWGCYKYDVDFNVLKSFLGIDDCDNNDDDCDCDYDNYVESLDSRINKILEVEKNYGE